MVGARESSDRQPWPSGPVIVGALSALALVLHFLTNGQYGYHGDELYFMACGEHLDFGYVDHAPLIAVWAKLSRVLLGDSLFALRLAPALAGALTVWLTGAMARELGGGRFAQGLAALAVVVAPAYLRMGNMLCIPGLELLWWTLGSYLVLLILKYDRPKLWLVVGLVAGIGLMHKHSMLLWGFGLTCGLLLTSARRQFLRPWIWLGGLVAFVVFLPNLIWQVQNDWPTLAFLRGLNRSTMSGITAGQFLLGQLLYIHPVNLPIWGAGVGFFLFGRRGRRWRVFAWQYLVLLALLLIIKSKIYYLSPVYPVLLAGGGVALEMLIAGRPARWLRPAVVTVVTVAGAALAPLGLPLLSLDRYAGYARAVTLGRFDNIWEIGQDFLFMRGWEEQVEAVAEVYHALPAEEKEACTILAWTYASAGAIDFFGPRYGLPKAVSLNLSYHMWGHGDKDGEILVTVAVPPELIREYYDEVRVAVRVHPEYSISFLQDAPVCVCRKPKMPLSELWSYVRT